ncbi:MAG: nucleotide exchange factor GrpE [Planctomycetes bacterium GWF2_50_10]|nr:MAG: nucleotide exchange factor GrpE [Planctomycetes bacterium GWF2_50_10]
MSNKEKHKKEEQEKAQQETAQQPADDQLEQLKKEKDDLFLQLQRVSADYSNFQKRVPRQIEERVAYEKEQVIKALLPVLDNFEHAVEKGKTAETPQALLDGVKIVYEQMLSILKQFGVEQITALGENFDPSMHQAIMQRTDTDKKDNIILEDFSKGYKLNGRVVRPSRVAVNKAAAAQTEAKEAAKPSPDGQADDSIDETVDTQ